MKKNWLLASAPPLLLILLKLPSALASDKLPPMQSDCRPFLQGLKIAASAKLPPYVRTLEDREILEIAISSIRLPLLEGVGPLKFIVTNHPRLGFLKISFNGSLSEIRSVIPTSESTFKFFIMRAKVRGAQVEFGLSLIGQAKLDRQGIPLRKLIEAMNHTEGPLLPDESDRLWTVSKDDSSGFLSIKGFKTREGLFLVDDVTATSPKMKSAFFNRTKSRASGGNPATEQWIVQAGPMKYRRIEASAGVLAKLNADQGVSYDDLVYLIENSIGMPVPEDDTRKMRDPASMPRFWIAVKNAKGSCTKIVFARERDGRYVVITALEGDTRRLDVFGALTKNAYRGR